ncbi:6657_t:CDS:2 [Ambispora gerdemannii]|uniref:arginine--tRNA ligase n=1 Tax=Ambispora gerdemannii TaxID=144530 RepID=A0A9N8YTQ5_9GLOM|nr:6657_t:CDS:2 [Ambispora gerdemannii]
MELHFTENLPPYGQVAVYLLTQQDPNYLRLVPLKAINSVNLKVTSEKPKISFFGVNIYRYLARVSKSTSLYDETNPSEILNTIKQDELLDSIDSTLPGTDFFALLKQELEESAGNFLVYSEKPALVDLAFWGAIKSLEKNVQQTRLNDSSLVSTWIQKIEAYPEVKQALDMVDASAHNKSTNMIPHVKGSDWEHNNLDIFRNIVSHEIAKLSEKSPEEVYNLLEAPKIPEHGDIAIAVPRLRIKSNPAEVAQSWVEKFVPNEYIISASASGHYINFKISRPLLAKILLRHIYDTKEKYGSNNSASGKTALVEFSSPNIAKPFHAGHLRSTIIGNFVGNVLDANGWKTIRMNYLGDWGKQYGLLAIGFEKYGSEEELLKDPIKHLYDVYVKINKDAETDKGVDDKARSYFKSMEDGDQTAIGLWNKFRNLSIEKYKETYARLNINFDVYSGESQISNKSILDASELLREKNLVQESQGAIIVDLKQYKLDVAVVQKTDGTTLYITRDIGAAIERYEKYKFDAMYYIVASQQDLHLKQLFKILELMGYDWVDRCKHINFGMVQGMSTRKGTAVFLDDILEQTKESMHEVMKQNEKKYEQIEDPETVADVIGISAIMIQDMSAKRIRNYAFNWTRMFSFEGDTGPYIQYAHARLCSIQRNCGLPINPDAKIELLFEKQALELIDMISQYPDVVKSALHTLEPCTVVTYAMKLSHIVSAALETLWVMGAEREVAEARLLMYWASRITLGNSLKLLGLKPLERM